MKEAVEAFLTHLAVEGHVSASTQNQALSAILFLYRHVLKSPLAESIESVRAKRSTYLPTVLTVEEVRLLLQHLEGLPQLMAKLLYGSGLRIIEGLRLRVKDLDFGQSQIIVGDTRGDRDRVTMLPQSRVHDCPICGVSLDKDLNASLNILKRTVGQPFADCGGLVDAQPVRQELSFVHLRSPRHTALNGIII